MLMLDWLMSKDCRNQKLAEEVQVAGDSEVGGERLFTKNLIII